MKNNNCFYCLNHGEGQIAENKGWYHPCIKGIDNDGLQEIQNCQEYSPNNGFQIGGYYTHMHFESDGNAEGNLPCLTWVIHSDGEFPTEEEHEQIAFHICDFTQIEEFVEFWGKELRKKGLIKND